MGLLLVYTTVLGSHEEHNKWSKHRMTDWFDGLPLVTEQGTHPPCHASASCLAVKTHKHFHFTR